MSVYPESASDQGEAAEELDPGAGQPAAGVAAADATRRPSRPSRTGQRGAAGSSRGRRRASRPTAPSRPTTAEPRSSEEVEEVDDAVEELRRELLRAPGDWYVVHSYAGYENKVKANLESASPA